MLDTKSMSITEYGLKQVKSSAEAALKNLAECEERFITAKKQVEQSQLQLQCQHKNLETTSGYIANMHFCNDCGFTWYD